MAVKLSTIIEGMGMADLETRVYYDRKENELKYFGYYMDLSEEEAEEEEFNENLEIGRAHV